MEDIEEEGTCPNCGVPLLWNKEKKLYCCPECNYFESGWITALLK